MANPFDEMAQEAAVDASRLPSDSGARRLATMGRRMVELEVLIKDLEAQTKRANMELWDLKTRDMPDLMAEIGQDRVGIPGDPSNPDDPGYDVVLTTRTHANIGSDWEEERRDAAFEHLDELGAGDIVRNSVTVSFGKGQAEQREEWLEKVRGLNLSFDPPELVETRTVPWNTLTAWIREQLQRGRTEDQVQIDLPKLGATHGAYADIKRRK